jgi:hypothetical protein
MNAGKVLYNSTEEALDSLGKSAKQMIIWQMSERRAGMAPDDFDIDRVAFVLSELLGEGSETVLNMVYRNVCARLGVEMQANADLPALEKINKVMEAKKMS